MFDYVGTTSALKQVADRIERTSRFGAFTRLIVEHILGMPPNEATAFVQEGYTGTSGVIVKIRDQSTRTNACYMTFWSVLDSELDDGHHLTAETIASLVMLGWDGIWKIVDELNVDPPEWKRRPLFDLHDCRQRAEHLQEVS